MPTLSKAVAIAKAYEVTLDWLAGEENSPFSEGAGGHLSAIDENRVILPRYDIRASAGAGALVVSEDVSEYFSVSRTWLLRNLPAWAPPNATVGVLEGSGDSMEETIFDGDLLMVVHGADRRAVAAGGIFVFSLDNELKLKRLQFVNGGDLRIISDNTAYEPETVTKDQLELRVLVHAQVFFVGGRPRRGR